MTSKNSDELINAVTRRKLREQLERDIQQFLNKGGEIQQIEQGKSSIDYSENHGPARTTYSSKR